MSIAPSSVRSFPPAIHIGEPAWDIAKLYPAQGDWSEEDYLELTTSNWLIEFTDGCAEVLPMPTLYHQLIVELLHSLLKQFVEERALGKALFAPLPVRLRPGLKLREPDIVFLRNERLKNLHGQPNGADLVMEVVSEGTEARERDLVKKPADYAAGGIAEYWIIDPQEREIRVLTLDGAAYRTHGKFIAGQTATSVLLAGFSVNVDDVFNVAGE
jgi:Uma2 family endonuclease